MLPDRQLRRMRADVLRMLPGTCVIQQVTNSADGAGGFTPSTTPVTGGTVACRIDPVARVQQIDTAADREALRVEYRLTVPYDAPLESGMQVVVGGYTYEVRQLVVDHSWNVSKRAIIARID